MASAAAKRIVPLLDRVLVKRVEAPVKTAAGILLPGSNKDVANEGVVVATGPGLVTKDGARQPMNIQVGDRVLLPAFSGQSIKISEEELYIFRDSDILAKLV